MEEILDGLAEIGYTKLLFFVMLYLYKKRHFIVVIMFRYEELDASTLAKAINDGPKSIAYTKLVEWITKELQILYSLDEHVNAITTPDDSSSFLLELSSFLKEIGEKTAMHMLQYVS